MSRSSIVLSLGIATAIFAVAIVGFQLASGTGDNAASGTDSEALRVLDERLQKFEKSLEKRLRRLESRIGLESPIGLHSRIGKGSTEPIAAKGEEAEAKDAERDEKADEPAVPENLVARLDAIEQRIQGLEEDPIERGYNYLASTSAELRRQGVLSLEDIAKYDPEARAAIRDMLQDPSATVRQTTIDTLADLGDKESSALIAELLADSNTSVRREAVGALNRLKATEAAGAIAGLVGDEDARVRQYAADALGQLKYEGGAEVLIAALEDGNEEVRGQAISSLGEIGAKHAATRLREMYDENPGSNRMRLAQSLNRLGDPKPFDDEFSRLSQSALEATKDSERVRSLRYLSYFFKDRSKEVFTRALEDPNSSVRRTAQDLLNPRRRR